MLIVSEEPSKGTADGQCNIILNKECNVWKRIVCKSPNGIGGRNQWFNKPLEDLSANTCPWMNNFILL